MGKSELDKNSTEHCPSLLRENQRKLDMGEKGQYFRAFVGDGRGLGRVL